MKDFCEIPYKSLLNVVNELFLCNSTGIRYVSN